MQNSFSGVLHHRPTNTQKPVSVHLEPGTLVIRHESETQRWQRTELDSARLVDDGSVILQRGDYFLDVADPEFSRALEQAMGGKPIFRRSFLDKIGVMGCLIALGLLLVPLLAAYFLLIPYIAERASQKVTPEFEKEIGDNWYESLVSEYTLDTAKTRIVQAFYDKLNYESGYDMRITVVHEPVVNAFAVPGGHIVVFDSIIGLMDAPEQLAGLLAHEASHVELKHSTRAIFRELANNLFISIFFGSSGDISGIIAQHGNQLAGLSYSRNLELEADQHGLTLMGRSHIPLRGMPDLFHKMNDTMGSDASAPTFLSTHPALEERIKVAEERIGPDPHSSTRVPADLQALWTELKALR